ncbi:MAG: SAVED domain-containing protein, partial [Actinomycetota bacterium]|nr:SAVED domain-containing protein [Actinomycetota bacterium]
TQDVTDSPVVTRIEIPGLLDRAAAGDGFWLIPVAAGGLGYDAAARAALPATSLNDFGTWNMARVADDPATDEQITRIARRALVRRLQAAHAVLPAGTPLMVDVVTRGVAALAPDAMLTVDLTHRFDGRRAHPDAWPARLLPALSAVVDEATRQAPGRVLHLRGFVGLPTAVALGMKLLAPGAGQAAWLQRTRGRPDTPYSLDERPQPSGFDVRLEDNRPDAEDLAVLVNVNADTSFAVNATSGLPPFRGRVRADAPGGYPHTFDEPGEAVELAHRIISRLREARSRYGQVGAVHLFAAAPLGLAFLLGQLLNTFGTVHTYEHVGEDGVGYYEHAVTLHPSS